MLFAVIFFIFLLITLSIKLEKVCIIDTEEIQNLSYTTIVLYNALICAKHNFYGAVSLMKFNMAAQRSSAMLKALFCVRLSLHTGISEY